MPKLVPLLREGADDLERKLLSAAREEAPPNDRARARTLRAIAALSSSPVPAKTSPVLHLAPKTLRAWFAVGGIGLVAAAGGGAIYVAETKAVSPRTEVAVVSAPATPGLPPFPRSLPPEIAGKGSSLPPRSSTRDSPITSLPPEIGRKGRERGADGAAIAPSRKETHEQASASVPASASASVPASASASVPASASASASVPAPASASAPAAAFSSLRSESLLLESTRASLAASHPDLALATLASYDARFPSGVLAEEAAVLRVEALLAAGRPDDARRAVAAFEQAHPSSSYVRSLRARVGAK